MSVHQNFEYHPVTGYRFVPGLKARIQTEAGGYLIRVNGDGFRSEREFAREKPPNQRRILLFGDSFTAGDGVSNRKRYSDLLEQMIPNLEVFNFGLPGTGTDQHYLVYREFAGEIEHDLLIIAVLVENIRRVAAHYRYYTNEHGKRVCYAKPYFSLENGKLHLGNVPPPREPVNEKDLPESEKQMIDRVVRFPNLGKLLIKTNTIGLAHKITGHNPYPQYNSADNPSWRVMCAILDEWIGNHSRPVLLMPVPFYYYIEKISDPTQYRQRFSEVTLGPHGHLHDPLPDLLAYPKAERRGFRFRTDVHLSSAGHQALATSLAPVVTDLLDLSSQASMK